MDRQKFVITVIFAVFLTTAQNFGFFLNFVPPQIYLRYFGPGGGPYSGKSADYRALELLIAI